ncbi:DNA repair protein rad16 [Dimargaris xerosporica]|nr:DNA repair protein rad16 [Dimargaris xerosporica]
MAIDALSLDNSDDDDDEDTSFCADDSDATDDDDGAALSPPPRETPQRPSPGRDSTPEPRPPRAASQKTKKPKNRSFLELHPELEGAWEALNESAIDKTTRHNQPANLRLTLLPFQQESLTWMKRQETIPMYRGGILADEMGMGKTIQMIALMLSEPRGKPNLVVAPTVAILQWLAEINTHSIGLNAKLYYGPKRTTNPDDLASCDVVLTSYALVERSFTKERYGARSRGEIKKTPSVLHAIEWHRIILDEAHSIKDRSCSTARACFALESKYKWALSGTPLQNRVGELYSLIRFMRLDPFGYYFCRSCDCRSLTWRFIGNSLCEQCGHKPMQHLCWWNKEILKPIQQYGPKSLGMDAFKKLSNLLDHIMLRRTKLERAEDLGLPPRSVVVRRDTFNDEEADLYRALFSNSATQFSTFVAEDTVLSHYANIFELLTRLRLAANHPSLVTTKLAQKYGLGQQTRTLVCAVCQDVPEDPIVAKCKHVFCREDAVQYIETSVDSHPKCPTCFAVLTIDLTQPAIELPDETPAAGSGAVPDEDALVRQGALAPPTKTAYNQSIVNELDLAKWQSSTKIEALVEELTRLRDQDATIKSLVFSQFVNFLDIVQWRLNRAGFGCCRLDGRMGAEQRQAVIKAFSTQPEYTVFLISLKAGGVALNLTEASQVFICDPWWNPAVEDQAMDRIHRLGQCRPIKITRLVIENSIESRIIELQEKKRALFQSTIGQNSQAMARLTEDDLQFLFVL